MKHGGEKENTNVLLEHTSVVTSQTNLCVSVRVFACECFYVCLWYSVFSFFYHLGCPLPHLPAYPPTEHRLCPKSKLESDWWIRHKLCLQRAFHHNMFGAGESWQNPAVLPADWLILSHIASLHFGGFLVFLWSTGILIFSYGNRKLSRCLSDVMRSSQSMLSLLCFHNKLIQIKWNILFFSVFNTTSLSWSLLFPCWSFTLESVGVR